MRKPEGGVGDPNHAVEKAAMSAASVEPFADALDEDR